MDENNYKTFPEISELKQEHHLFAEELILRLKHFYRLYEVKPYPTVFLIVSLEICDAIFAISFVFRCHYRQVYYALHDELIDAEEFEKFCFSLPVARGKRFTFNFLFRISFIFELTMYLFKEGYDYFDIARRCIAEYPDVLYFDAAGGWARVNAISTFIICVSKVWEVDIAVEHPLLGTFVETGEYIPPDEMTFDIKQLMKESREIDKMIKTGITPNYEQDYFNPKDMQSIKVLYKHFVAPRTPKTRCNPSDLLKISETFPLTDRVPFAIEKECDTHYFVVYELFVEKKEILYYFRSYMDPEILEKYFPLKQSPDSPDEENYEDENLNLTPDYYRCYIDTGEEGTKSNPPEDPRECEECLQNHYERLADMNLSEFHTSDLSEEDSVKSNSPKASFHEEFDNMEAYKSVNSSVSTKSTTQRTNSLNEEFPKIPPWLTIMRGTDCTSFTFSPQLEQMKPPVRSVSNITELRREQQLVLIKLIIDVSRLSRDKKELVIKSLPAVNELDSLKLPFLRNILVSVQHSPYSESSEMNDALRNILYVSPDTKYVLFKIIMNCSDLLSQERNELFRILFNVPDNPVALKASIIRVMNSMSGCPDQVKSDLICCVINLTDEECNILSRAAASISITENFEGIFPNEEDLHKEYERCTALYTETDIYLEKLQELYRCTAIQKERDAVIQKEKEAVQREKETAIEKEKECSSKSAQDDETAKQIASRPRAIPRKISNKPPKNVSFRVPIGAACSEKNLPPRVGGEHKREFPFAQEEEKYFEGFNFAAGLAVSASFGSFDEKYCQKPEVPTPPPNMRRCKTNKKSKRRSRK